MTTNTGNGGPRERWHRGWLVLCALPGLVAIGCRPSYALRPVPGCPLVELARPGPQFSAWDDDTVAMAASLTVREAKGNHGYDEIELDSIEITGGRRIPQARMGMKRKRRTEEMAPVYARFHLDANGTLRNLRIRGRVIRRADVCPFVVGAMVAPARPTSGTARFRPVTARIFTIRDTKWPRAPSVNRTQGPETDAETPPIPEGLQRTFIGRHIPPTRLARLPELPPGAPPYVPPEQGGPNTATFTLNKGGPRNGKAPPDPSTAAWWSHDVVMMAQNYRIAWSIDGGNTITQLELNEISDPAIPLRTTFFPSADNGFGSDQVLTYAPQQDLFIWVTQSWSTPISVSGLTVRGPNRLRVAYATAAALRSDFLHAWSWFDVDSALLGIGNDWIDYPDVTVSNGQIYLSVDRVRDFVDGDGNPGSGLVGSRFYMRWALADLVSGSGSVRGGVVELAHNGLIKGHILRGSSDTMYFAGLYDTSTLRLYTWPDTSESVGWTDIRISRFPTADGASTAPDGRTWNKAPGGILGATMTTGCVAPECRDRGARVGWFGFSAGRDAALGRPEPYVRLEAIELSRPHLSTEVDIWNPGFAFSMPSLASSCDERRCDLAIALGTGGGGRYGETAVGFGYDWLMYITSTSTATQAMLCSPPEAAPVWCSRFGDYYNVTRARSPTGTGMWFGAFAYGVIAETPGQPCWIGGCKADPHYVAFGHDK